MGNRTEDLEDFEEAVLNKNSHAVVKTLKMSETEAHLLVNYL